MPQTMKQKRIKAIALWETAIARWESVHSQVSLFDEAYRVSTEKISRLKNHIFYTSQKLGYGNRKTLTDIHKLIPEGPWE